MWKRLGSTFRGESSTPLTTSKKIGPESYNQWIVPGLPQQVNKSGKAEPSPEPQDESSAHRHFDFIPEQRIQPLCTRLPI